MTIIELLSGKTKEEIISNIRGLSDDDLFDMIKTREATYSKGYDNGALDLFKKLAIFEDCQVIDGLHKIKYGELGGDAFIDFISGNSFEYLEGYYDAYKNFQQRDYNEINDDKLEQAKLHNFFKPNVDCKKNLYEI